MSGAYAPLDITAIWARINDELIELVDLIPEGQLDWSPRPEQWNFKGILLHMVFGRHGMMGGIIGDGGATPDVLALGQTKDGLQKQLRSSWERMEPFLRDRNALAKEYTFTFDDQSRTFTGHWLAFGQLEHDIHHRADMYHYLGMLGVEHGEPDTLERALRKEGVV